MSATFPSAASMSIRSSLVGLPCTGKYCQTARASSSALPAKLRTLRGRAADGWLPRQWLERLET